MQPGSLPSLFGEKAMLVTDTWKKELEAAHKSAHAAGAILSKMYGHVNHVTKKGDIDLVTDADLMSEQAILEVIRHNFPGDNINSEESGKLGEKSNRTWLIDPLDGTTNFAHCFPFFAVSIALEVSGRLVLGVVYNPYMDEYFEASEGAGAYLNNRRIEVSRTAELGEALLGTGFPYDIHDKPAEIIGLFGKMIIRAQGIRRPGAAALDLCYVAAGRLDGFWEQGLKPWDTAAGAVILKEAGGKLSSFGGAPYTPYMKSILAANPLIHDLMLKLLKA